MPHCLALRVIAAVVGLLIVHTAPSAGQSVDWKFYGGEKIPESALCFYDAKNLVKRADGHIRVWTKCLLQKDFEGVDPNDSQIVENVARFQPASEISYELDCAGRMLRDLSFHIVTNGHHSYKDEPSDWGHIPPEGNSANLLKLLCPLQ